MPLLFADIIIPLALRGRFTYSIPESIASEVKLGSRVLVQLGKRRIYSGIVARLHDEEKKLEGIRPIIRVASTEPAVNEKQLKFWHWISDYYMCSEGEVMNAAYPSAFLPSGETFSAIPEKYKPREETFIRLAKAFSENELNAILDKLARAPRQESILSEYLIVSEYTEGARIREVSQSLLLGGNQPASILNSLISKGIFERIVHQVARFKEGNISSEPLRPLSMEQQRAYLSVRENLEKKDNVLLHGVTSSGKTEIYIHLIEEQLKSGKQVLYMLPEIALTTQIIERLRRYFGNTTGVYHSRFNDQERAEIWKRVAEGNYNLILGVRSSVFLPFSNLGLVIVDEEHDGSYKQHDPSPRYNGRDSAILLASIHGAKTILGSASPSIESYHNAETGKYGLVTLKERYGNIKMPSTIIANTREAYKKKRMVSHFTPELLHAIDDALGNGEQIILFQNRRGFSPYIQCPECGWIPVCNQCAVNLTYHKGINKLVCHYCGYTTPVPEKCGSCGSHGLATRGFGTEKIEDEIKIVFPAAVIARMDQDTTRNKNSFSKIIRAFEEKRIDILIGTQMISKGLDFENLTVVGILNADNLLNYPDFRAHERSFQLMEQVSGRAGRRNKQGKVIIQTSDPSHRIIGLVIRHDYDGLYRLEAEERASFNYPPFTRMIKISVKHKDRAMLNNYAGLLGDNLRKVFGKRILGPEYPVISQVQLWYIKTILIKIEREGPLAKAKEMIQESVAAIEREKGSGGLRISIDVDPY
jgi:primosomal protein N' (replication factor Y) (superfamily II helicase)